jgi:hypothetical protein
VVNPGSTSAAWAGRVVSAVATTAAPMARRRAVGRSQEGRRRARSISVGEKIMETNFNKPTSGRRDSSTLLCDSGPEEIRVRSMACQAPLVLP